MTVTTDAYARRVLSRFRTQIRNAANAAVKEFSPRVEYQDVEQEAKILVLSYAGILGGWQSGILSKMEDSADDVNRMLADTLTRNVKQVMARQVSHDSLVNIDELPEDMHPLCLMDDELADYVDRKRDFLDKYPTLTKVYLQDVPENELAESEGITDRALRYRLEAEKAKALEDPQFEEIALKLAWCDSPRQHHLSGPAVCPECGQAFELSRPESVDAACSLECWLCKAVIRKNRESSHWETMTLSGYYNDPRQDRPKIYEYKGWK